MRIFTETMDTLLARYASGDPEEQAAVRPVFDHVAQLADAAGKGGRLPTQAEIEAIAKQMGGDEEKNKMWLVQCWISVWGETEKVVIAYDPKTRKVKAWA